MSIKREQPGEPRTRVAQLNQQREVSRRATPVARERNPTAPHARQVFQTCSAAEPRTPNSELRTPNAKLQTPNSDTPTRLPLPTENRQPDYQEHNRDQRRGTDSEELNSRLRDDEQSILRVFGCSEFAKLAQREEATRNCHSHKNHAADSHHWQKFKKLLLNPRLRTPRICGQSVERDRVSS